MKIGISIGDLAGIGPEVLLKALARPLGEDVGVVVYGARDALERENGLLGQAAWGEADFQETFVAADGPEAVTADGSVGVVDVCPDLTTADIPKGEPDERAARLQQAAFERAVADARREAIDAVCTAPWNKSLFGLIDEPCVGHTDVLDDTFKATEPVMMLAGPQLRVSLVTTHLPLRRVPDRLTSAKLEHVIKTTVGGLSNRFGIEHPTVAVCGLTPHAGGGGVMGEEEQKLIEPTLEELQERLESSVDLRGPFPSDTLFAKFRDGQSPFDAVVAMYHDQGLIPLKLMHFGQSANVTLGLPLIRTSVDHGTAYDIAGQGVADAGSMRYALELAVDMARRGS